eukprot:gnl/TRDRNA2_/TRDRNA2_32376_c0_seq1.p1 gnl/TRDRNA2_/TRDRNA2_32376_c0~~gnl/TRDRNA2_/TRDRNA2_32376_c0_seq1.p1  ORF type:complete len:376 (-),score=44.49 gnl/TRDRNA2_/TRDRNA2_32376_c0_seq1:95-1222(-)
MDPEVCKFYAQGRCAFGTACRLAHVDPPCGRGRGAAAGRGRGGRAAPSGYDGATGDRGTREVCRFFLNGGCSFGDSCRNLHVVDVTELDADPEPREYSMSGLWSSPAEAFYSEPSARPNGQPSANGPYPERPPPAGKGSPCPGQQSAWVQAALHDLHEASVRPAPKGGASGSRRPGGIGPPTAPQTHDQMGGGDWPSLAGPAPAKRAPPVQRAAPAPRAATATFSADVEDDAECGICFDSIRRKGERFGMLESCDHAFCLSCIRSWRKQREQQDRANLRLCPVCRNQSFFVVPCDRLIVDPEEKRRVINEYKRQMSAVPCKAFDYGRGNCPFGTSCFYAHLNPDGTQYVPPPSRRMVGANGTSRVKEVILSDFFS